MSEAAGLRHVDHGPRVSAQHEGALFLDARAIAWMARAVGVDAFGYVAPGGGSLRGALEWALPYATGARNYTKPEVTPFDHGKFFQVLRVASRVWPDGAARYEAAIPALKPGDVDYDGSALNLVWPRVEPAGAVEA